MPANKRKSAKKSGYMKEISQHPTLEELMWAVNGMKKCKVFTKLKFDKEGNVAKAFTKKGAELYGRLTALIYGVFNLATEGRLASAEDIVETLDGIVRLEW